MLSRLCLSIYGSWKGFKYKLKYVSTWIISLSMFKSWLRVHTKEMNLQPGHCKMVATTVFSTVYKITVKALFRIIYCDIFRANWRLMMAVVTRYLVDIRSFLPRGCINIYLSARVSAVELTGAPLLSITVSWYRYHVSRPSNRPA